MPKRATGVHLRAGSHVWQWRVKSPKDLRHLYPSEWAHRCSLGTASLVEANIKAARLYADWLATFDGQRQQSAPLPTLKLSPEFTDYMSTMLLHDVLAVDDELRNPQTILPQLREGLNPLADEVEKLGPVDGMPYQMANMLANHNQETLSQLQDDLRRRDVRPMFEWLRSLGFEATETTPGIRQFLDAYLKAAVQAAEMKVSRDQGVIVDTPPAPTLKEPAKPYRLRDVFEDWKASKGTAVTPDTVKARERALSLYEEFTGDPPITEITRKQGDSFRAWLLAKGGATKTANDRLVYVKSLFAYAYRDLELIPRQPWHGIDIDYDTEQRRYPWTADQIRVFFSLPLFNAYALPQRAERAGADAAYWIPLLGLFTGARAGELCQLHVSDVVQEGDVLAIDINAKNDGKRIKTSASWRKVPIHSELIRLGFLDYVTATRNAGHVRLWPKLHLNEGKPSLGFSRWFNEGPRRSIPDVQIPDFHSLRHTARSAMTAAGVSEQTQDLITGHEVQGSAGTRVYRHVAMSQLRDAVHTMSYPSLSLERSYPVA